MSYRAASVCVLCFVTIAPAPALAQDGPFRGLFANAVEDFGRLASKDSALILTIGGVAAAAGHLRDRPVTDTMSGPSGWHDTLSPGETIGGARMQAAGAIVAYSLGRATGNETLARVGGDLIRAQIVTQALTLTVKTAVGRTRPDGTQYSFPSGHSAVTFASATVLQRNFGWKAGVPAYAVASYVAASRIQAKRHFLSDVTFGAALGIVAGRTVTVGRGDRKFAVSPMATPGGAGVSFTLVR
jgi:membrane-associated phospholipid phosphatase